MINWFEKCCRISLLFVTMLLFSALLFFIYRFEQLDVDSIWFHLRFSQTLFSNPYTLKIAAMVFAGAFVLSWVMNRFFLLYSPRRRWGGIVIMLACILFYMEKTLNLKELIHSICYKTKIYEDNYIPPPYTSDTDKNLVFIYLESIEAEYADETVYGQNLLPRLSRLAEKHESFEGLGQLSGMWWTMGSMVAGQCGLPLIWPPNESPGKKGFMANARCLGDILAESGYRQKYIIGSHSSFAGQDVFYQTHGIGKGNVIDVTKIKGALQNEGNKGWGVRDSALYREARREVAQLAKGNAPFALYMKTLDTHFPGYRDEKCQAVFDDFRDIVLCADSQAADFVEWISRQDFAEKTLIVVMGDHLAMSEWAPPELKPKYQENRTMFNLFVNVGKIPPKHQRRFSALDIFPTVLEALGADLPERRAGLGVSLWSEHPSLREKFDNDENLNREFKGYSSFYNSFF